MHVFYAPDAVNGLFYLPAEESHHCLRVLRFRHGDSLIVTNGRGLMLRGELSDENPAGAAVRSTQVLKSSDQKKYNLHIAISPLKNASRFDWFVEKAVELRVSKITPLICGRTERKNVRIDRLNKIALESMKQSMFEFLPVVDEPVYFNEFVKNSDNGTARYIASCSEGHKHLLKDEEHNKILVLIGPEGDFCEDEVQFAQGQGFVHLSLGDSRLRTETAGIYVAASMYCKYLNV